MTVEEEFEMEQYRSLRTEINNNTAEIRSMQRYALVTVAVVWSWIATNAAPKWVAFTPLAFIFLGVLHTQRVLRETRDMGFFIAGQTEPFFHGASLTNIGWEGWLRTVKPSKRKAWFELRTGQSTETQNFHNPLHSAPLWLLWIILTLAVVAVGYLQSAHPFNAAKSNTCCCTLPDSKEVHR